MKLLVTTKHRGVFFGDGPENAIESAPEHITLKNARMVVSWSSDMQGVFGLAVYGPSTSCRIGPSVSQLAIRDVTSVMKVHDDALPRWEEVQKW